MYVLLDQFIRYADENEQKLKDVKSYHEKQIGDLKYKIADLTAQVNYKFITKIFNFFLVSL